MVENIKDLDHVYRLWLRWKNTWLWCYYVMLFLLCTCILLGLLENGAIMVEMTKSHLWLCDAYVGDYAMTMLLSCMLMSYVHYPFWHALMMLC